MQILSAYSSEIDSRLRAIDALAASGGLDAAVDALASSLAAGGVIQAFGTGHSEAFAMEIAGRAGGFIPTHALRLADLVLLGGRPVTDLAGATLERDGAIAEELYGLYDIEDQDVFVIASNSGANGSTVALALTAQAHGHTVIAVTSIEHSKKVESKHPSGRRLFEVADIVIDNLAPYGDATLGSLGDVEVGPVSSITGAYIAQLLTLATAQRLADSGVRPPMYLSANIPGGDEHNHRLEAALGARIKPYAYVQPGA